MEWKSGKKRWYEAVRVTLDFPFFDGRLTELLRF